MMNPFAEIARYYINRWHLRSPVVVRVDVDAGAVTIGLRSPRNAARHPRPSGFRNTSDVGAIRTITFFGSDGELSVSHRAPKAYFSDEIRLQRHGGGSFKTPRWPDAATVYRVGPFRLIADTASRQARGYAASILECSAQPEDVNMARAASCYTLASRRIPDGTAQQRDFDPHVADGRSPSVLK